MDEGSEFSYTTGLGVADEGDIAGYMEDLFANGHVDAGEDYQPLSDIDGTLYSFPEHAPVHTPEITEPLAITRFRNPFLGWFHRLVVTVLVIPVGFINGFVLPPLERTGQDYFDDAFPRFAIVTQDEYVIEEPFLLLGQISDYFDDENEWAIEEDYYEDLFQDILRDLNEELILDDPDLEDLEYNRAGGRSKRFIRKGIWEEGGLDLTHDWEEENMPGYDDFVFEYQWMDADELEDPYNPLPMSLEILHYYNRIGLVKFVFYIPLILFNFSYTEIAKFR